MMEGSEEERKAVNAREAPAAATKATKPAQHADCNDGCVFAIADLHGDFEAAELLLGAQKRYRLLQ